MARDPILQYYRLPCVLTKLISQYLGSCMFLCTNQIRCWDAEEGYCFSSWGGDDNSPSARRERRCKRLVARGLESPSQTLQSLGMPIRVQIIALLISCVAYVYMWLGWQV